MRLGVCIEETWGFFEEVYADFEKNFETDLFKRRTINSPVFKSRLNRSLFRRDMQAFLKRHDVVFFEWASGLLAAGSHHPKSCAIVTRLHRYELYKWIDKINWKHVDQVILVSRAKEQQFLKAIPRMSGKTSVISPSTRLDRFAFFDKPYGRDLGILCHLTPRKRVYELILSLHNLNTGRGQPNRFHLHIGGGAHPAHLDYFSALQHLVSSLGLDGDVTFYGHVTDTAGWYQKIDVLISNSFSEGLQVSPMEGMATGCYVLSHHWHGAAELVPTEHLFLSPKELEAKICAYDQLDSVAKRDMRRSMRRWACSQFDINRTSREMSDLIRAVGARQ